MVKIIFSIIIVLFSICLNRYTFGSILSLALLTSLFKFCLRKRPAKILCVVGNETELANVLVIMNWLYSKNNIICLSHSSSIRLWFVCEERSGSLSTFYLERCNVLIIIISEGQRENVSTKPININDMNIKIAGQVRCVFNTYHMWTTDGVSRYFLLRASGHFVINQLEQSVACWGVDRRCLLAAYSLIDTASPRIRHRATSTRSSLVASVDWGLRKAT